MYFIVINAQSKGPYTLLELKQMLDRREVEPMTLVHERCRPNEWAERRFLRDVLAEHLPPQHEPISKSSETTNSPKTLPESDGKVSIRSHQESLGKRDQFADSTKSVSCRVGGWLLFYCVGLTILSPLFSVAQIILPFYTSKHLFPSYPSLQTGMMIEAGFKFCILLYGVYVGWQIWTGSPAGRNFARSYLKFRLVMVLCGSALSLMVYYDLPETVFVFGKALTISITKGMAEACYFLVWFFYFKRSKRVAATYGQEADYSKPPFNSSVSPAVINSTVADDETLYEQAMNEVQSGTTRPGLWAKAFAEASGEVNKQRALYILYRVEQIKILAKEK